MKFLDQIIERKKNEVKILKQKFTFNSFNNFKYFNIPCLDFKSSIMHSERLGIIAEIKQASPSKGNLRDNFNHLKIAETYFSSGADAVSVLTDKNFFNGSISYLLDIADIRETALLRKDFIIDELQILEAKANGADTILLISEILCQIQIRDFSQSANELGMQVLLELHSTDQLKKIDFTLNDMIGINNRDLATFLVNIETTKIIRKSIPDGVCIVSESGIKKKDDLNFIKSCDVHAVLVGEHFMRAENIEESFSEFKTDCYYEN